MAVRINSILGHNDDTNQAWSKSAWYPLLDITDARPTRSDTQTGSIYCVGYNEAHITSEQYYYFKPSGLIYNYNASTPTLIVPGNISSSGAITASGFNSPGGVTFAGLTSSAGILITNGANISFSAGGNIATTGTASFGRITVSGLKSNGIISGSSTLNIVGTGVFGDAVTANAGFKSTGVSNLSTITSSAGVNASLLRAGTGINSSGYLSVQGDTQLGNNATDTTSVWGTLSIVNAGSNSGSITSDASGNLILDGSGTSSGVQITDGVLWLGASGSTGIQVSSGSYGGPSYTGGMISSSMKVVALHGFANRTDDDEASFEVDTYGNLECASLKETSLRQYKHEIYYITESQLLNISKLKPVTFLYNQDVPQDVNDTRLRQAGFIAEQVQQIYPEVAWYKEGKLAGLQYQRLTAYLTRGIQELAEQNKLLKSRVQSLEQLVNGILQGAK